MKNLHLKTTLALAVMGASLAGAPAQAVEISFTGGSNIGNLTTVTGDDGIGDTWQTSNGPANLDSNFAMSDLNATPQAFNSANFSNGFGTFANSFQLTLNNSQAGVGFKGIELGPVASGLENHFIVMPDVGDPTTWITWNRTYNLLDAVTGLFQQVLFTAPAGTELVQGQNFATNINFAGIMTADSGWAASFNDRAHLQVSEPGTEVLFGMGLLELGAAFRRRSSRNQ